MTGLWLLLAAPLVVIVAVTRSCTPVALLVAAFAGAVTAATTTLGAWSQAGVVLAVAAVAAVSCRGFFRPLLRGPYRGVIERSPEVGVQTVIVRSGERLGVRLRRGFFPARADHGGALVEDQPVAILRFERGTAVVEPVSAPPARDGA